MEVVTNGVSTISDAQIIIVRPFEAQNQVVDITPYCTTLTVNFRRNSPTSWDLTMTDPTGIFSPESGSYVGLLKPRGSIIGATTKTVIADATNLAASEVNGVVLDSVPLVGDDTKRTYTLLDNPGNIAKYVIIRLYNGSTPIILPKGLIKGYRWRRSSEEATHTVSGVDFSDRLNVSNVVMRTFKNKMASDVVKEIAIKVGNIDLDWTVDDYKIRQLNVQGENSMDLIRRIIGIKLGSWRMSPTTDRLDIYDHFVAPGQKTYHYIDRENIFTLELSEESNEVINYVRVGRGGDNSGLLGTAEGELDFQVQTAQPGDPTPNLSEGIFKPELTQIPWTVFSHPSDQPPPEPSEPTNTPALPVIPLVTVDSQLTKPTPRAFTFKIDLIQDCHLIYVFGVTQSGKFVRISYTPYRAAPWTSYPALYKDDPPPIIGVGTASVADPIVSVKLIFRNINRQGSPDSVATTFPSVVVPLKGRYKIRFYGVSVQELLDGNWPAGDGKPVTQVVKDDESIKVYGLRPAPDDIEEPLIPDDGTAYAIGDRFLKENGRIIESITKNVPWNPEIRPGDKVQVTESVYGLGVANVSEFIVEGVVYTLTGDNEETNIEEVRYVV